MMFLACLIAATALAFSPEDAKAVFDLTGEFVKANPVRNAGRYSGMSGARWLKAKASIEGGNVHADRFRAMTPKGERPFTNLYCPFKRRPGLPWTVLVSHYDTKPGKGCPGANDGGVTSCLLVRLAKLLFENRDFKRNVMLVWTDGEECAGEHYSETDGFQGSKRAAARLKELKYEIDAVYVLDMLGDRDLTISIPGNVTPALATRVITAAKRTGLKGDRLRRIDQRVLDDHLAFLEAGFPAIDLIDFEYGSKPGLNDYWHTPADTPDKLSSDSILSVGRLVCELLNAEAK